MKTLILCGGHVSPALALIESLENRSDLKIYFFGRRHVTEGKNTLSAEFNEVSKTKAIFVNITTGRLQRKFTIHTIPSLLRTPIGFIQSFYYLLRVRPDMVISFGSYLSVPVVIAAWLLRIPQVLHEQATIPGIATRINSHFVKKVFLTWRESAKYFKNVKTEVIGNLVRNGIFTNTPKHVALKKFLGGDGTTIYITGGNQGSHFINKTILEILPKLSKYRIIHQVGNTNFEGDLERAKEIKMPNYMSVDFVDTESIGSVFKRADLIIGRSGANTVWELAILKKVSVLIPLPHSGSGEQLENAKRLEEAGSAIVLPQKETTGEKLLEAIDEILKNHEKYQKNADTYNEKLPNGGVAKMKKYIEENIYAQNN